MERYVLKSLKGWVMDEQRKPLLLKGARQVGKTWLVDRLAQEQFDFYIKIDFEEHADLISLFSGETHPHKICSELEHRTGLAIVPGRSLLFFDEIQACPQAIPALRQFYEQMPDLHVIAATSLPDFPSGEITFPIDRVQVLDIYPLSFSEFLLAMSYKKAAETVRGPISEVPESMHQLLMEQLRMYWVVGGMPESLKAFATKRMLKHSLVVLDEICARFRMDFNRYTPKTDVDCIDAVFTALAASVGQQIKYTSLAPDYAFQTIKKAFEGLLMARIASKIKSLSDIALPFDDMASDKKFKCLYLDIALMNRLMDINYKEALSQKGLMDLCDGQLAKQFVGQEFTAANRAPLFYWARDSKNSDAEVDYLFVSDGVVYPVEVKEGPLGKLRSLSLYRQAYKPSRSVVFHPGQYEVLEDEKITFVPLYFAEAFAKYGI
jgi:hypothetical protein